MAAYPLSRRDLVGRNLFMFLITFTMIFSGGLIPTYLLVRELGMINTRWVMMIPNAIAAWNVIITRTYYQTTISDELLEAAQLDGCSDARFIWQIVVPLSGAITAVNTLFYAVGHWNAFFNAFIYLNDDRLFPLQIVLREILIANDIDLELTGDVIDDEARQGLRRAAQVLPDRGGQRAGADDVPLRAEVLRPRRDDRLHQGMTNTCTVVLANSEPSASLTSRTSMLTGPATAVSARVTDFANVPRSPRSPSTMIQPRVDHSPTSS